MGDRAVIFMPDDGFARRYIRDCHEHCLQLGLDIAAVTTNPTDVWAMMDQGQADVVVVAREAHLRCLVREPVHVVKEYQGPAGASPTASKT